MVKKANGHNPHRHHHHGIAVAALRVAKKAKRRGGVDSIEALEGKRWDELSRIEKDRLMVAVLQRLGVLDDEGRVQRLHVVSHLHGRSGGAK